ncbi:hypothetical protein Gohar_003405, partial [Gossypium harknessii]|nr:hypothetical protein [Gossypium harknessii]
MGVSIRPEAMAWLWICLSWSMDLLDSIRENGGSREAQKRCYSRLKISRLRRTLVLPHGELPTPTNDINTTIILALLTSLPSWYEGAALARYQTWVWTVARYHSTTRPLRSYRKSFNGKDAPAGNRTRVCTVAGYYSTTRPLVLLGSVSTARFVPPDLIIQEEITVSCKMGVLVRPELYGSAVDLFELVHGFAGFHKREGSDNCEEPLPSVKARKSSQLRRCTSRESNPGLYRGR